MRQSTVIVLGLFGPQASAAVPALIDVLRDRDSTVRQNAALALGQIGPEASAAVPALIDVLRDRDSTVRQNAVRALKQIGPLAIYRGQEKSATLERT